MHGRPAVPAAPGPGAGPDIRNIVTVASPIDMESGRGAVAGVANIANGSGAAGEQLHQPAPAGPGPRAAGAAALGDHPGIQDDHDPIGSVTTYWDLVAACRIGNPV